MRIPERWLRAYCDPAMSAEELEHRLTMSGLEVEERTPVAPSFNKVVVARVVDTRKHPDADRLTICEVDAGEAGRRLQVVCGAPNVRAGLLTALALPGASLPGGVAIEVGRMRGIESQGMLCSAKELSMAEDLSLIHI